MTSLLVTSDFPPKIGGIQTVLHELWRRLPPDDTTVLTTAYDGAAQWDVAQPFRVERVRRRVLLPTPGLARHVDALAREVGADVVFLDPALPLGLIGPHLRAAPVVVVIHGAEVTLPGRLFPSRPALARVLQHAAGVVAVGEYPAREAVRAARRELPGILVPPGVDAARFRPAVDDEERAAERTRFGLDPRAPTVVGVSRLVPRKGFDVLIDVVAGLDGVQLAIGGAGRDLSRLTARARRAGLGERARFLGRVPEADLPALYRSADVFAMLCRDRWNGLEAEGFGVVFLEAAASGVPAIAGRSGGSHEAVVDGETGCVVEPREVAGIAAAVDGLLRDPGTRARMGAAARARAEGPWSYEARVAPLRRLAAGDLAVLGTFRSA